MVLSFEMNTSCAIRCVNNTYTALRDSATTGDCASADAANVVETARYDEGDVGMTGEWLPAVGTSIPAHRHGELGAAHCSLRRSEMLLEISPISTPKPQSPCQRNAF